MREYDALILGAGGAGMMCAITAGRRGKRVLLLDHAAKLGGKILISGGGRCNFTNVGASSRQYVSENPHFMKSAMSRFTPEDFVALVQKHGIAYHEKKLGQLFCDESARQIVEMLAVECADAGSEIALNTRIEAVRPLPEASTPYRFEVLTPAGSVRAKSLVVATGGLSIPKIGATGFGYEIARQFGLRMISTRAALDGFTFGPAETELFSSLAGTSVDCEITAGALTFRENILFTHAGLSGPAALQASLHWQPGEEIRINLSPDHSLLEYFRTQKRAGNRSIVKNLLSDAIPSRLAVRLCELYFPSTLPLPQVSEKALEAFCDRLHQWRLIPSGTVGYTKAEVTRGGVDTDELSSKTLEAKKVPGLHFIGEVVDVTGWLGGYNFQWAWASGAAAGTAL